MKNLGAGEWGSVWDVEALRPLEHLPSSAYRSLQVAELTGSNTYTIDNTPNFRPLAVKLCKRETKYSSAARTQRLWNEFKILRMLMDQLPRSEQVHADSPNGRVRNNRTGWHPNVVNFYEFLLTPTLAMLVMPKFDEPMKVCLGETLCLNFFEQLLSALHWLHEHHVCHNDIKVDNLGVTYDTSGLGRDVVTLFDFGFAHRYDPLKKDAFMSRDVWGTPEYLSPERCRATLHDERKADMWALGITFFEMLTGRTPFEHHDEKFDSSEKFEVYYTRAERGTWLGEWDLSADMENLIRKMLRHDPQERVNAAGALLDPLFDPQNGRQRDSFDDFLQISYEDAYRHCTLEEAQPEKFANVLQPQPELDDSDSLFEDLVQQENHTIIEHNTGESEHEDLLASPGISRAAVATRCSRVPPSPSLSQVGMDSRLTDLMCMSPPWRGPQPPREGTPIPSARRNLTLPDNLVEELEKGQDESDSSVSNHSPVAITKASRTSVSRPVKIVSPTKQSPFRLRLGQQLQAFQTRRPNGEQMASTPVSADAVVEQKPVAAALCPTSLPPVNQEKPRLMSLRTELGSRGNVVASLAKKFDATNFLARPPPHVPVLTAGNGLGLTIPGAPLAKTGPSHRRSKSNTLACSKQHRVARHSVRRSTGSFVPSPEEALPRCARRLFGPDEPVLQQTAEADNITDVGSAQSDTKGAGGRVVHEPGMKSNGARTPALHAVLAGDQNRCVNTSLVNRDTPHTTSCNSPTTPAVGEEVIFKKLKKMASLAGLLSRMIDETKSTILSPEKSAVKTPLAKRGSNSTDSTSDLEISPGLLHTPEMVDGRTNKAELDEEDAGNVSLVSAAFSLDLSGSARRSSPGVSGREETGEKACQEEEGEQVSIQGRHTSVKSSGAASDRALSMTPSAAQVETMYSSFLLSQHVCKSGSGFLSPAQPASGSTASIAASSVKTKHRSLAALFSPSTSNVAALQNLLLDAGVSPGTHATNGGVVDRQRSVAKSGKLTRLFRKQY